MAREESMAERILRKQMEKDGITPEPATSAETPYDTIGEHAAAFTDESVAAAVAALRNSGEWGNAKTPLDLQAQILVYGFCEGAWSKIPSPRDELVKLAQDIADGKVFGTWNIPANQDYGMCFMTVLLGGINCLPVNAAHLYEYLSEAAPRSANGMPCFFSHRVLAPEDTKIIDQMMQIILQARKDLAAKLKEGANETGNPRGSHELFGDS